MKTTARRLALQTTFTIYGRDRVDPSLANGIKRPVNDEFSFRILHCCVTLFDHKGRLTVEVAAVAASAITEIR